MADDLKYYMIPNNGNNDSSDSALVLFMFVNWGIVLPLIALFGVVGNTMTMVVLSRLRIGISTLYLLRALAITDTGILLFGVYAVTPLSWANNYRGTLLYFKYHTYPMSLPFVLTMLKVVRLMNVCIVVAISVERYTAICHPFLAPRLLTRNKTAACIATILAFSGLNSIHEYVTTYSGECQQLNRTGVDISELRNGINDDVHLPATLSATYAAGSNHSIFHDNNNNTSSSTVLIVPFACMMTLFREVVYTEAFRVYDKYVIDGAVLFVLPIIFLVTFNALLIKQLIAMFKKRNRFSTYQVESDTERDISVVLAIVVIVFLVFHILTFITVFNQIAGSFRLYLITLANNFIAFNSSANIVIYTTFGLKFRRRLSRTLRRCYNTITRTGRRVSSTTTNVSFPPLRPPLPPPTTATALSVADVIFIKPDRGSCVDAFTFDEVVDLT